MAVGMDNNTSGAYWLPMVDDDLPILWQLNIIGNAVLDVVITCFVALRCYVSYSSRARLLLEDWMCLCAWFFALVYTCPIFAMSRHGAGYHQDQLSPSHLVAFKKGLYAASATYSPAAVSNKTTLLLIIARAFASKPRVSKGVYIFIVMLVIMFLPIQICKMAICTPVDAFWDDSITDKKCLNQGILFVCDSLIAVLSDLAILVLPIYLTWSLSVTVEKKLQILILLGAGGIAVVGLTAYRLYKSWLYAASSDITVDIVPIAILSTGELSIGIICACLPSVHILLERRTCSLRCRQAAVKNKQRDAESMGEHKSKGSTRFSSWLSSRLSTNTNTNTVTTTQQWDHQPTNGGGGLDHKAVYQVNVDVELGTITETVGEEEMDITRGQGRSGRTRVLSIDGRREGWLAAPSSTDGCGSGPAPGGRKPGKGPQASNSNNSNNNNKKNMRTSTSEVTVVEEAAPQWDFIWDGRRTAFTDGRLQELKHERPP